MKLFKVVCVRGHRRTSCIEKIEAPSLSLIYSKNFATKAPFNTKVLVFNDLDNAKSFASGSGTWQTFEREIWEVYHWGKILKEQNFIIPCYSSFNEFLGFWDRIKKGTLKGSGSMAPRGTCSVKTVKLKKRVWKNY